MKGRINTYRDHVNAQEILQLTSYKPIEPIRHKKIYFTYHKKNT